MLCVERRSGPEEFKGVGCMKRIREYEKSESRSNVVANPNDMFMYMPSTEPH